MECGEDEARRAQFITGAINDWRGEKLVQTARTAKLYYDGLNPTINLYEKILYDISGKAHRDLWTANHKIASKFFGFAVDQEVSYLLGNGVSWSKNDTAKKLSPDFDIAMQDLARAAKIGGVAFGFWDFDRLRVFDVTELVPLYDEENGALMAAIRFWQVAPDRPLRATLYELDGVSEYLQPRGKSLELMQAKKSYKQLVKTSQVGGVEIYDGENYPGFPIVPLKNNHDCLSELVGRRNTIDALDLASSNMVNNTDEGNLIYWVLSGYGGMDDLDVAKFIERIKTMHVAQITDRDESARVEPHSIEAPFAGTSATIDMLQKRLYDDFQCFDASAVSAGNQTATAIKASYVPLDLQTDKFEAQVTKFLLELLRIAGIDDQPSYTRNQIINKTEETQAILLAAQYYDEEYITRKLLTINGDIDQYDAMARRKAAEEIDRSFVQPEPEQARVDEQKQE